jgi:hypothetical protein
MDNQLLQSCNHTQMGKFEKRERKKEGRKITFEEYGQIL